MGIYWVQGLRRETERGPLWWRQLVARFRLRRRRRTDWRPVLCRRLAGRQAEVLPGEGTRRAEIGLGFPQCVYFYVGRTVPPMGMAPVAYEPLCDGDSAARVTPFDTGGMYRGMTSGPARTFDAARRRALVHDNSFPTDDCVDRFQTWGRSAFASSADYVIGMTPTRSAVAEIEPQAGDDARRWTWEARVPVDEFPMDQLQPVVAFLADGELNLYQKWVRDGVGLTVAQLQQAGEALKRIRHSPETGDTQATEWLRGQALW